MLFNDIAVTAHPPAELCVITPSKQRKIVLQREAFKIS